MIQTFGQGKYVVLNGHIGQEMMINNGDHLMEL